MQGQSQPCFTRKGCQNVFIYVASEAVTQWIKDLDNPATHEAAAAKIVHKYADGTLRLIRRMLSSRLKGVINTDDVRSRCGHAF